MTTSRASTSSSQPDQTSPEAFPALPEHEQATIQAGMNRIIPTTDLPGAEEARTMDWLNTYLSGPTRVWAKPDGSGFVTLSVRLERVWHDRIQRLRRVYGEGVVDLDKRAQVMHGKAFRHLAAEAQDEVLRTVEQDDDAAKAQAATERTTFVVERANSSTFDERTAGFFDLLVVHTRQAFYSNPVYGGNAEHVGWSSIGFAGPDSMADVVAGRYTTLPYFNEEERT